MSNFLLINGYPVPVSVNASGEVDYQEVGGEVVRAYAGNLLSSVKATARVWKVVTVPMPNQMALGLASTLEQPYPLACDGVFVGGPVTCRARGVRTMAVATAYGPHRVVEFELHEEAPAKSPWSILFGYQGGNLFSNLPLNFSRSSPALYRDRSGVWQEAAPGVPRTTWGTDPVTGLLVPRYLTEPGGENLIPWSEDFGQWSHIPGTSVTPVAGAWRVGLDGPVDSDVRGVYSQIEDSIPEGGPVVVWAEVRAGSHDRVSLTLNGGTTSSDRHVVVDLSTGDVLRQGSDVGWVRVEPLPDGWWHVAVYYPAAATSVSTRRPAVRLVSGTGQTMTGDGSEHVLVRVAQCELGEVATSLVRTTGAPAPRSPDSLYLDLPPEVATPGVDLAIYSRYVMLHDPLAFTTSPAAWGIAASSGVRPRLYHYQSASNGRLILRHDSDSSFASVAVGSAPAPGDLVETLSLVWTDAQGRLTGRLIASVNRGPLAAADLPPLAPAAAWSAPRLYIGSRGTAPGVYEYEALKVYAGRLSGSDEEMMAFMAAFGGV